MKIDFTELWQDLQEQQFTLILQTLAQLRAVYGDSIDKIVQGNVSNIVYLKSTDDSMLETLEKMGGTRHVGYRDSKTVTRNMDQLLQANAIEGKVSYNISVKEEPVIKFNDMMFIPERNSIVFRAGDSPIWNRNEMILPMSHRLFRKSIEHPGHTYSLKTIPTMSSASEFDVGMNQPNFIDMVKKRMMQAERAVTARSLYQQAYDYSDFEMSRLDKNVLSAEIMDLIRASMWEDMGVDPEEAEMMDFDAFDVPEDMMISDDDIMENIEQEEVVRELQAAEAKRKAKKFAHEQLSIDDLLSHGNAGADEIAAGDIHLTDVPNHTLDNLLLNAYNDCRAYMEKDTEHFQVRGEDLCGLDGSLYVRRLDESEALKQLADSSVDEAERTFMDEPIEEADLNAYSKFELTDEFYFWLASRPSWRDIAQGRWENAVTARIDA